MAFLDDFQSAVSNYPASNVTISVVDLAPVPPSTGPAVNINEIWSFQVRVRNNGNLNMTGVSLLITGKNGTTVSTNSAGPFSAGSIAFGNLTLNGHGGQQDTVNLYFRAPSVIMPAGTQLVTAQINGYDANLDHILIDHTSGTSAPTGSYNTQVFPT